jgi:hypothetical protein
MAIRARVFQSAIRNQESALIHRVIDLIAD